VSLQQAEAQFRKTLENASGTETHRCHHRSKHVQKLMLHHQILHQPETEIGKTVRPGAVKYDWHIQPFALRPDRIVGGMIPGSFVDYTRSDEDRLEAQFLYAPAGFGNGEVRIMRSYKGGGEETLAVSAAKVEKPVVVRMRNGCREFRFETFFVDLLRAVGAQH